VTRAARLTRGFDHFAIRAYDIDATLAFYTSGLGFTRVHEWTAPGVVNRCVFLDAGDGRLLELFDGASTVPGAAPAPLVDLPVPTVEERGERAAIVHVALRSDDVDGAYRRALDHGATSALAPLDLEQHGLDGYPDGTIRIGFVRGLDGETIEFIQREDLPA
jgi:glyoxylase I family protein